MICQQMSNSADPIVSHADQLPWRLFLLSVHPFDTYDDVMT